MKLGASVMVRVVAVAILSLIAPARAYSQMSTRGEYADQHRGASQDPTDASVRHQKHTMGQTPEDWSHHLDDPDPARRLEAVKLLGGCGDPAANQYLERAVDSSDARVATAAVDYLGKLAAQDASEVLAEKLFLNGTDSTLRRHLLAALGKIRNPESARRVIDFARGESDPELRAAAIRAVGEIGEPAVRPDLETLAASETNPGVKTVFQEALATIATHQSRPTGVGADSSATFSHFEPAPTAR